MSRLLHKRGLGWTLPGVALAIVVLRMSSASLTGRQISTRPKAAAADFGRWTFIGPASSLLTALAGSLNSGRVTSVAVDPADPNHWLVGAALGGVWDTPDAGVTWQPRTDGQPSLAIGAISFSPSSPNVVYAGTGEANYSSFNYAGAGMLRSNDSGGTWSVVNTATFARASVKAILVHPADPNIVVAATGPGRAGRDLGAVVAPPIFGIQRSTDGGANWTRLLAGQVSDLVKHPDDFSRQYAAIGLNDQGGYSLAPGTMPNGLYRTTDMGNHWTPVAGPWTSLAGGTGYMALAVAPSNPDVMYASLQLASHISPDGFLGLFRTNNAWAATPEWIQISAAPAYCVNCQYANVISVDPGDPDTVFAGGVDMFRCRSCADRPTWLQLALAPSGPTVHNDHHGLTWVGNRLIDVDDGGVYSSIDRGATWANHNAGLPLRAMYSGAVHPTSELIVVNTQDTALGVKRTSAGLWERLFSTMAEGQVVISSRHPDTDWAMTHTFRQLSRTTDGGRSLQQVQAGLDLTGGGLQVTLRKCPANDDVIFVGTNKLWRTNDFFSAPAPTWSVNGPQIEGAACYGCTAIRAVAFPGSDASCSTYAFGGGDDVLRITTNGGASWFDLDPSHGIPSRAVTGLAFAPSDPNVAYVTLSGFDEATPGKAGHVFKSTNALARSPTWTNVTPPVNLPFNTIVLDPTTPSTVFVGADNGVWASNDAGAAWTYVGPDAGLPNTAVFDLQIQASTGKVFAFTFGRGAFVLARGQALAGAR